MKQYQHNRQEVKSSEHFDPLEQQDLPPLYKSTHPVGTRHTPTLIYVTLTAIP